MPEIDSLAKDFESEINDADITVESEVDHNQTIDSNQDQTKKEQSTDSTYNFDKTTVILGLQILPATAQSERQVLLSAGIKGSPPIISSTTLTHIEQAEALVDILASSHSRKGKATTAIKAPKYSTTKTASTSSYNPRTTTTPLDSITSIEPIITILICHTF